MSKMNAYRMHTTTSVWNYTEIEQDSIWITSKTTWQALTIIQKVNVHKSWLELHFTFNLNLPHINNVTIVCTMLNLKSDNTEAVLRVFFRGSFPQVIRAVLARPLHIQNTIKVITLHSLCLLIVVFAVFLPRISLTMVLERITSFDCIRLSSCVTD